jgi:hypothetical protein
MDTIDHVGGIKHVIVRVLPNDRVDRRNAAIALGRAPKTLAEWKLKGIGPRPFLVGGRVFYRWTEVQDFARGGAA